MNRFRTSSGGHASLSKASLKSDSPMHSKYRSSTDSLTQISPRSDQSTPPDWRVRHEHNSDPARFLQRPLSQPSQLDIPLEETNRRQASYNAKIPQSEWYEGKRNAPDERRMQDQPANFLKKQHHNEQQYIQPLPATSQLTPQSDRVQASGYPFLSSKAALSHPTPGSRTPHEANKPIEPKQSNIHKGPLGPEALRRIRDDRLGNAPPLQQRSAPPEPRPNILDALDDKRSSNSPKYLPAVLAMERSESFDQALQSVKEGENGHRNSLALALDNNRRHGRMSPFPQAVQGAQSRSDGPSRDPSIKNEFSRMFAGIGSGVSSSGLAGSGTSTPFPPSPKQGEERLPPGTRIDLDVTRSRTASRMGNKRQRRLNDDTRDREGSTRADGEKGAKRTRHHHHPPGHQ